MPNKFLTVKEFDAIQKRIIADINLELQAEKRRKRENEKYIKESNLWLKRLRGKQ